MGRTETFQGHVAQIADYFRGTFLRETWINLNKRITFFSRLFQWRHGAPYTCRLLHWGGVWLPSSPLNTALAVPEDDTKKAEACGRQK